MFGNILLVNNYLCHQSAIERRILKLLRVLCKVQIQDNATVVVNSDGYTQGRIQGERPPPSKTYESIFFHNDFVKFGKQHSRYEAILSSIVLPQKCCEVYFMPLLN